jgi:hypothetical protein
MASARTRFTISVGGPAMRHRAFTTALLVLLVTGCNKSSPTEPSSGSVRCGDFFLAKVTNTSGAATIKKVQLILDGQVFDISDQPVAPVASFNCNRAFPGIYLSGHHSIAVLITDQTTTPNPYKVSEASVGHQSECGFSCCSSSSVPLPDRSAILATGESISYTFDL